jgi:hypothetical protein
LLKVSTAIPNSERIYAVPSGYVSSTKLDFKEKSRVSASENFDFGITAISIKIWTKSTHWRIVRGCGQIFARIALATARAQRWLCLDTS